MGKSKSGASEPLLPRPDGDAVSLHTQNGDDYEAGGSSRDGGRRGYLDDVDDDAPELFVDGDDMPPLYSDIPPAAPAVLAGMDVAPDDDDDDDDNAATDDEAEPATGTAVGADGRPIRAPAHVLSHTVKGAPQKRRTCIDRNIDTNAELLLENIAHWGRHPPRPFARLRGTHTQTEERRSADGKTRSETNQVVDFDVKVELTPLLYANARLRSAWRTQRVVENYERVRRGTVFACRGPQYQSLDDDPEAAPAQEPTPDLAEWCRRYCDPAAPALRVFSLSRRMVGFDTKKARTHLEKLVRQTNYRGHLAVSFPTDEEGVDIYSDHLFNRWRLNRWIRILFYITGLFLFAWPYLFFMTKRYEVVSFNWAFSRLATNANGAPTNRIEYVSLSEDQWYNLWARAISKAVLDKRQKTLDQEDLRAAEGAQPTFESTGNNTVDGALGFVQAGLNAMNQVNRHIGWGGDC